MEIMKARNDCMNQLLEEARSELAHRSKKNPTQYKKVLEDLIVNGLIKLLEKNVSVLCRACDKHLVEDVLASAKHRYLHIMKESTGKDYEVSLEVDNHHHLPPGPEEAAHGVSCSGGVILTSYHGKIRCINTLDERLAAVLAAKTPELRKLLFS
jgi:V-type H+-transporting ATPase subunit E